MLPPPLLLLLLMMMMKRFTNCVTRLNCRLNIRIQLIIKELNE